MVFSLAAKLFGSSNERTLKRLSKPIPRINELEPQFAALSDEALRAKTAEFKARLEKGEHLDAILPEAFATVREAAKRTLGQRHYDVQLIGGAALHNGKIAEMRTGEGKTLVATLPAYLNAISGKGVHIVTVNDYLAKRDSEWMGRIYKFLGMSVGCILSNISDAERKAAYAADITYGTNNEFGFDYLRDNMKFRLEDMVQRPFNFAIVDEVDSILIDEARTPLIISGPAEDSSALYISVNKLIPLLTEQHFEKDEKSRTVNLTDAGVEFAEEKLRELGILQTGSLYDAQNISVVHHVNQALKAHKIFSRDVDYIVKSDKVIIIDEFTGRMMEGRRYSDGLHQALEAKEGAKIENENQTLASITFQNYFRLYPKLGGMTGTAKTEEAEFEDIYNLSVVEIPTNLSVARIDHNDRIYKSYKDKTSAILGLIRDAHAKGQPILVGTTSIEKSEMLSAELKKLKITHQVLNARYHETEAQIISQAGKPGAVTIATNMAGRGTDIQLGGNFEMRVAAEIPADMPEAESQAKKAAIKAEIEKAREDVRAAGGLLVIGTERHESRRIDNQLRGRSGRQGDPGATVFFLSLEDDLMRIFGAERLEPLLAHRQIGLRDGEALSHPLISKTLEKAQNKVEQQNFEIRKNLLKFDNVMNDQRKVIYEQRREIMNSNALEELVRDMRADAIYEMVVRAIPAGSYPEQWAVSDLKAEIVRTLNIDLPIEQWAKEEGIDDAKIEERIIDSVDRFMAEKVARTGSEVFRRVERAIVLQRVDHHWKEHLHTLDHLRQGINLRAFAQRDPLNEYKAEAFALFQTMLANLREGVTRTLSYVEVDPNAGTLNLIPQVNRAKLVETREDPAESAAKPAEAAPKNPTVNAAFDEKNPDTWDALPRNAACPCGSGKKYKHCHGKLSASV
ncbi:MAG: preprotein translocase subunit SecA [Proteobacteria bacterium]|nr:preprotein translocase subunit SecA [Pseudomonadota bacterium]